MAIPAWVAKQLTKKQVAGSPEAQAALDKEWLKLLDQNAWDMKNFVN